MAVDVHKRVTHTTADGEVMSQSETTTRVPTRADVQDAEVTRSTDWVWYIAGLVDLLVALRWLFLLFGARSVGFAAGLYQISDPFIAPFKGIFPAPSAGGAYFDTASVVAFVVYILIAWVIVQLIDLAGRPVRS